MTKERFLEFVGEAYDLCAEGGKTPTGFVGALLAENATVPMLDGAMDGNDVGRAVYHICSEHGKIASKA